MVLKYFFVLLGITTSAIAQILLKLSANKSEDSIYVSINYYIIFGIFFYGISFLLYIYILKKFPLSSISPIMVGGTTALIVAASYFMGESITLYKLVGIFLILLGILILFAS